MAHPSWRAPGDRRRTLAALRLTAGPMDGLEARLKVSVLRLDEPHHDRGITRPVNWSRDSAVRSIGIGR